jgi:uncharacterized protein YkwD
MGRLRGRGLLIGAALVVVIGVASASALVFQGRGDGGGERGATASTSTSTSTSSSTTTSSTTTSSTTTTSTTTTTVAPPPPPTDPAPPPAPAPVPAAIAPPPPPAAAPTCDGGGSGVIDAMNGDRAANGLGGLCGNSQLAGIAQSWAQWMADHGLLAHQDLGGVLNGTPFTTMGENILDGPSAMSAGQMEAAWMQSPPHRANILNGAYRAAGVGIAYGSDGRVWVVVDFGG